MTSAVQCPPGLFPAVNPASLTDPQAALTVDFISGIMDANNLQKYVNVLPNPLTPGFVYSPAGNQGGETWYTVSQRQITQSAGLIYQNPLNPADPNNGCSAPPATFWTYGDARDNGLGGVAPTAPHSNPGPTFDVTANSPVRVTWTNELPATHPVAVDPTLDCGPLAPNCWPYNRTVIHLHGSHVADDSDGQPDAWFSANFLNTGHTWKANSHYGPTGTYRYENTQEAATLWYHDHAMGQTHINAYVGLAGFFIVRDANELALQKAKSSPPAPAVLPKYPYETAIVIQDKVFGTNGQLLAPEKPIQDFNALLTNVVCDPLLPTTVVPPATVSPYACAAANLVGGAGTTLLPTTPCDPLANIGTVYACPTAKFSADPLRPGALVPDPLGTLTAPSITPESFGNIILVNGQAWPKLDVEQRVYRVRMLNGSDSRTYILRLMVKNPVTGALTPAPAGLDLWQIGTEQGLLNAPVKPTANDPTVATPPALPPFPQTNAIVLMPGERVDMLIDFKKASAGSTIILQNIGPDGPYTGEYPPSVANAQLPTVLAPEIMAFNVIVPLDATVADTLDPALIGTSGQRGLRPAPITPLVDTVGTTAKQLYLAERLGPYGRLALTINGKDYMQTINELTKLNDTETWEIYNLTPDAHPIHLHLVAFQVINRQGLIDPATNLPYTPPMVLPNLNTPVDPLTVALDPAPGAITAPAPNELLAWKDTITMLPGTVTRVRAKFDIPGLYVYHCHILSHEENDMMRPYVVTTPATQVNLTSSAAGNSQPSNPAAPVTFTAQALTGLTAYPETNGFEYQFSVTPPAGVTVTQPDNLAMMAPGTTPGYSLVRNAAWTPPTSPGTYLITVNAKPIGAPAVAANLVTNTLNFTVVGPAVAGVTSSTADGTYRAGATVNVTLAFNQTISSVAGLTITLNSGATITTGPLTNVTSFSGTYTVAAGQNTPAGQFLDVTTITGSITDAAGNRTTALTVPAGANLANNKQISIDNTPPVAVATPGAGNYASLVSVELITNEAATIYYTTNGTTPTTASTIYIAPIQLSSPTTAVLTLNFLAVDLADNASTMQSLNYTIHQPDLTAALAINNGAAFTTSQSVMLAVSATDPLGVTEMQVACDGINYAAVEPYATNRACTLPSGDGLKTVLAKFKDSIGNWYPPINAQITLDTTAPVTTASPAAGTYSNSVTVALSVDETATIYYTTDGTDPAVGATPGPTVYTGPFTLSSAITTNYTVKYLAVDQAGNVEALKNVVYTLHVNDLVGSIRINGGLPYTATTATTLTLAASDPAGVTEMQFSNDGVDYTAFEPYATSKTWLLTGGEGVKTVYVKFKDGTGTIYAPYTAAITLSAAAATTPIGDLNGDGKVNLADAVRALKISVGLFQPTIDERVRGDVAPLAAGRPSPDGVIDSGDVLVILKRFLTLVNWN